MTSFSLRRSQKSSAPSSFSRNRRVKRRFTLESLESRTLLSYTFSYTSPTATVTGTTGTDSLVISPIGGNLEWSVNNSAFSSTWTGGTPPATAATTVDVTLESGDGASLQLGGNNSGTGTTGGPASALNATFILTVPTTNTLDKVVIDDSSSAAASTYTVNTGTAPNFPITGPGIIFQEPTGIASGGITLKGSSGTDTYNVVSTFLNEPVTIDPGSSSPTATNVVNVTGTGVATNTTPPSLTINDGSGTTVNYSSPGLTPVVTAGAATGDVVIALTGFGTVDANSIAQLNLTPITVPAIPITLVAQPISTVEGFNLADARVATFTAPLTTILPTGTGGLPASDFLATINWGDGTVALPDLTAGTITQDAENPSVYDVTGTHTFLDNGSYTVATTVFLKAGSSPISSVVNGVPVTVTVTFPSSGPTVTPALPDNATVTQGSLIVSPFPIVGTEGLPIAAGPIPIATFIDAGGADPVADYAATINLINSAGTDVSIPAADIAITQNATNAAQYTVNVNDPAFTWPEEGTYQVLVSVTDKDPANPTPITVQGASQAVIADAPLNVIGLIQPTVTQIGTSALAAVPVAYFTDTAGASGHASDFTATIDWGDGTPPSAGTITTVVPPGSPVGTYGVTGSHTYAEQGPYPIQVFIVDVGGSKLTVTNGATVTAPVLTVAASGDGLAPTSDSGLSTGTSVVGAVVTNVSTPTFIGTVTNTVAPGATPVAEANARVTLTATNTITGAQVIGTGVTNSLGAWRITSTTALANGTYTISATATDQFGLSPTTSTILPSLLIDTTGPVIDGVTFDRLHGQVDYVIQNPVSADGTYAGLDYNSLVNSSNYLFTKVHANKAYPGEWTVTNVAPTPDPTIANAYDVVVTFNNGKPIQGGYYLFTIRGSSNGDSSVQDLAENHLSGVFYGSFPSGNGINGSDFDAELVAVHNTVFAPQTIIGTSFAGDPPPVKKTTPVVVKTHKVTKPAPVRVVVPHKTKLTAKAAAAVIKHKR